MAGKPGKGGGRRSTTWGPGQGGRPPVPQEVKDVRELAQVYTQEAVDRLVFWMRSGHASASPAATQVLLDRGHGKALQKQEVTGANGGPIQTQQVEDFRAPLADVLTRAKTTDPETRH
jgi:hypothetical protein